MAGTIENVMANDVADYIDVSTDGSSEKYELMGLGITSAGKTLNPQEDTKQYVNQGSATTTISSYQPEYPFEGEMIKNDKVIDKIYTIGRDELKGAKAQVKHVRVELFKEPTSGTKYPAQRRVVTISVSEMPREAGTAVGLSGSLKAVTDVEEGTFDITTKTFEATAAASMANVQSETPEDEKNKLI